MLRRLLERLVHAAHEGPDGVSRDALDPALWPDEKLNVETRDRRLHRGELAPARGLGAALGKLHEGAYRLTPGLAIVHLSPLAWPASAAASSADAG
ncbi:MAG: hypothetical protein U1F43_20240 [Myxococcota bacterium]